jgi:thiosulfate/3-mercaptopyruvate sulfurtransferase
MPGSLNLPYTDLHAADGTLLGPAELRRRMQAAGVDPGRPVIATCGSGTSACALLLALEVLGTSGHRLYDGAWTEWAGSGMPVKVGA